MNSLDRAWPHSVYFEGDAPLFVHFAEALARGEPFERDLPIHSPVVAYLLYGQGYGSAKADFTAIKVLWCTLSAVSCGLAYLAIRRTMSNRVAWIAAVWLTFSFGGYVAANSLNNETIYTFVIIVILLATLRLAKRARWGMAIALGALHGLATLTRAEHTLLVILLAGYLVWEWRRRDSATRIGIPVSRRVLLMAVMGATFIGVCLPWSIHGSRAARRMNEVAAAEPDYARAAVPWTASARALLDSLPAFSRADNFEVVTSLAVQYRVREINEENLRQLFEQAFGYVPEPMSTKVFVSSQGPLSFALANRPESDGGFSKAALLVPGMADIDLQLSRPSHLKLYNRGYEVGLGYIRGDYGRWLKLVGRKLSRFADGATLGLGAFNLPYGRQGVRRPVDMMAPPPNAMLRKALILGVIATGLILAAWRQTCGVWALILAYKLIVAILFFGYARQAVSILPALVVFGAMTIDSCYGWVERRTRGTRRWSVRLMAAAVAALLILDVNAARRPLDYQVDGRPIAGPDGKVRPFETFREITIRAD